MAITIQTPAAAAPTTRRQPFAALAVDGTVKPKAQLWLNIGYEANGVFIQLPFGIALDNMNEADVRGQNADFVKQRTAQNNLLKMLKDAGMKFEPGQEEVINLELRLRRVKEELVIPAAENEYAINSDFLIGNGVPQLVAAA